MSSTTAYAKINLGLRILRRREDGYHDIETIFHRVDANDEIFLRPAPAISLSCNQPELHTDKKNLCLQAARLLSEAYDVHEGVQIELKKNIPIGAGLGGGSSDAASTLLGLNQLWKLNLSIKDLEPLALRLGSDVPYFLHKGSAYGTGRGEKLEYFDLDLPYWIVIVYPNIHISTAWAYQHTHISHPTPVDLSARRVDLRSLEDSSTVFMAEGGQTSHVSLKQILVENLNAAKRFISLVPNDFEPLILRTYPVVAKVKRSLYDFGAEFAQISGSGSSVYGLFANEHHMQLAAERLRTSHHVFITPPHFRPV